MDKKKINRTTIPPNGGEKEEKKTKKEKELHLKIQKSAQSKKEHPDKLSSKKKTKRRCLADEWLTEEGLAAIKGWKQRGLTDAEVEKHIGISHSTFCEWKRKYPDLSDALTRGRARADAVVENALYKQAVGFIEEHEVETVTKDGKIIKYIERTYNKPDTKAMIFYLTNRLPKEYRSDRGLAIQMLKGDKAEAAGGIVQLVVQNDSLEQLEKRAIEEARQRDAGD